MKLNRIISIALASMLLLAPMSQIASTATDTDGCVILMDSETSLEKVYTYTSVIPTGDINNDSKVNSLDVLNLRKYLVRSITGSIKRLASDIDSNGTLTLGDQLKLRMVLVGKATETNLGNTATAMSYDADNTALKLSVTTAGTKTGAMAEFAIDETMVGNQYFTVVTNGELPESVKLCTGSMAVIAATLSDTVSANGYTASIYTLPTAIMDTDLHIEVMFASSLAEGTEILVDSLLYNTSPETAKLVAQERVDARKAVNEEFQYYQLKFDSASKVTDFVATNHTTVSYNPDNDALRLQVTGANGDPWALMNLDKYNISADTYKYVVYKAMIPLSCNVANPEGEIFWSAGDINVPTAGYSNQYSHLQDGEYHSFIFQLSNADFWTGTVHSLRLDYFCSCTVGDTQLVKSITFCNTYDAAQALCDDRRTLVTNTKKLFFYGLHDDGNMLMPYRMYVPFDYDSSKVYPMLTLLHGSESRGEDNTYQLTEGFPKIFNQLGKVGFTAITMVPQCPKGYRWAETDWTLGNYSTDAIPESMPMKCVVDIINDALEEYNVDRSRLYVSGNSMGGFGTWDIITRHPDLFAAAMPICGGGDPSKANILKDIPIWAFHGTSDPTVPEKGTKAMYDTIVAAGGTKIKYTPFGGQGHCIWDQVWDNETYMWWLFSQKKGS